MVSVSPHRKKKQKQKQEKDELLLFVVFVGFTDSSPLSPLHKCQKEVGDDDVFMVVAEKSGFLNVF